MSPKEKRRKKEPHKKSSRERKDLLQGDNGAIQEIVNVGGTRAIFPGSFDPITNGHLDIIERGLKIFDHIVVAVLHNPDKTTLFSVEERVALIHEIFATRKGRVSVLSFSGLLVSFVEQLGTHVILRGLRATSDFDYEAQMALMNRQLSPEIETFFLMTSEKYSYVSSSLVKQIAPYGGDVSGLVPDLVRKALRGKYAG